MLREDDRPATGWKIKIYVDSRDKVELDLLTSVKSA